MLEHVLQKAFLEVIPQLLSGWQDRASSAEFGGRSFPGRGNSSHEGGTEARTRLVCSEAATRACVASWSGPGGSGRSDVGQDWKALRMRRQTPVLF